MKLATTAEQILDRLKTGTNSKSDIDLARFLGISHQAIYNARNKNKVPMSWGQKAAERFGLSTDWVFFGTEPMHRVPISKEERTAALEKLETAFEAMGMTLDPDMLRRLGINVGGQEPPTQLDEVPIIGTAGCNLLGVPLNGKSHFAHPINSDLVEEILKLNNELREARAQIAALTQELQKGNL